MLQGVLSYMADVHTWGRHSAWKLADGAGACVTMAVALLVILGQITGWTTFPAIPGAFFTMCVLASVWCKYVGGKALQKGRERSRPDDPRDDQQTCHTYLRFHTAWHFVVPLGTVICQIGLHFY